jgi:hypothetical protein
MLYLGTSPHEPAVKAMLDAHEIGLLSQPKTHLPKTGWIWAADNGCFGKNWLESQWLNFLSKELPRSGCLFAAVPDSVGDHFQTLSRWKQYHTKVRELRYPVAFVAQNGANIHNVPWDEMDCVFIGGDTEWKLSPAAYAIARHAKEIGKWVHVGRVNSLKRMRLWKGLGDSVDGTFIAFGPARNAARVKHWVDTLRSEQQLEGMTN